MPVNITDIRVSNEFNTGSVRYLHGNVFWKLNLEIDFNHKFYYESDADNEIIVNPLPLYSAGDGVIQLGNTSGEFAEIKAGDIVQLSGFGGLYDGSRTVLEVIDNSTIRVNIGLGQGVLSPGAYIYLNTSYDSIDYFYGLVGNNEPVSYNSKIDNTTQRFQLAGLTGAYQTANPVGQFKSWLLGDCQIKTNGTGSFGQRNFQIKQTVYINPLFLRDYDNLLPPSYFLNNECLRHVFRIEIRPTANDFTRVRTLNFSGEQGNSGWLNENFNTGITNYSLSNISFVKESDLTTVDGVLLVTGDRTKVEFDVDSTLTPFSAGNTEGVINFINVPFEDAEYKQTTTTQADNFMFDRVACTEGGAPVSGTRVIEDAEITFISSSKLHVTFYIELDTAEYNKINAMDTQKYLIAFSTSDFNLACGASDGVTLLVKYDSFVLELGTDNVVTADINRFIQHPDFGTTDEGVDNDFFPEDEVVNYTRLKIDATNSFTIPSFQRIESGVRLYNTVTFQSVVLDSISQDVSGSIIVNGIQQVNSSIQRSFQAPVSEAIKNYVIQRQLGLDANPIWYYDVYFPFLVRWEYWELNNQIPGDFYDTLEANNGLNNFWQRLDGGDWVLQAYHEVTLNFSGSDIQYLITKDFVNETYLANTDWINEGAVFEDLSANNLGLNILGFADTKVKASFTHTGTIPLIADLGMVLRLEPKENGGRYISTGIGSYRPKGAESQFKSVDLSDKVVLSISGNTITGEALIDYTKLQGGFEDFSLTARVYDKSAALCAPDNIIASNGDCLIASNGDNIIQS